MLLQDMSIDNIFSLKNPIPSPGCPDKNDCCITDIASRNLNPYNA
jgi:hypothetical protein